MEKNIYSIDIYSIVSMYIYLWYIYGIDYR